MADTSLAVLVDGILAANKTLAGIPSWEPSPRNDADRRLVWPLRINDTPCGTLEAVAFPFYGNSKEQWKIMVITADHCVSRLDFNPEAVHTNPLNLPSELQGKIIWGPHYHAWADNRHLCTASSLPVKISVARLIPSNIRTFQNSLRWFCGENNIELPTGPLVDLPPRETLL